jgi:hypothetical protein
VSWESRADLAEAMVAPACDLAGLVHDGDAEGVAAFLGRYGLGDDTPPEAKALVVVLAAMVPVDERSAPDLLAWVGGGPVTVLPSLRAEDEPEPEGHTAQELRDAAAEAMRLKRARKPVPDELAVLVAAYRVWRKQVQGLRKAAVQAAAMREDDAAAA